MSEKIVQAAVPDEVKTILERIYKWHGEFPDGPLFNGKPQSYGAAYGSNGERDYMRNLAGQALSMLSASPTPPSAGQTAIKLPRRKGHSQEDSPAATNQKQGWDDCLDEISRLNSVAIKQPDSAAPEPVRYFHTNSGIDAGLYTKEQISAFPSKYTPVYLQAKPQRITEQDAREIIEDYMQFRADWDNHRKATVKTWMGCDGRTLLAKLNEHREPDYKAHEVPEEWRVTKLGQIKVGDVLSLVCGDNHICTTAKEILNAGTSREEVIYNRKKNHYFITSMVLDGTSTHKHVFIVPNPAIAKHEGGK